MYLYILLCIYKYKYIYTYTYAHYIQYIYIYIPLNYANPYITTVNSLLYLCFVNLTIYAYLLEFETFAIISKTKKGDGR